MSSSRRRPDAPLTDRERENVFRDTAPMHARDAAFFEAQARQRLDQLRRGPLPNSVLGSRAPVVVRLDTYPNGYEDLQSILFELLLLDMGPATARSVIPRLAGRVPLTTQIAFFRDAYQPDGSGIDFRNKGMWAMLCLLSRDFSRPPLPYGEHSFGILNPKDYRSGLERDNLSLFNRVYAALESRDPKRVAAVIRKAELDDYRDFKKQVRPADRYCLRSHAIAREATRLGIRHGIKKYEF
jgi:hypothetical protein